MHGILDVEEKSENGNGAEKRGPLCGDLMGCKWGWTIRMRFEHCIVMADSIIHIAKAQLSDS